MEEQEIVNGNALVAKFEGWYCKDESKYPHKQQWYHNELSVRFSPDIKLSRSLERFDYHNNWKSLMRIVDKIESMGYSATMDQHCKEHRVFFNQDSTMEEVAHGARGMTRIEATYKAVVDFINYYNSLPAGK